MNFIKETENLTSIFRSYNIPLKVYESEEKIIFESTHRDTCVKFAQIIKKKFNMNLSAFLLNRYSLKYCIVIQNDSFLFLCDELKKILKSKETYSLKRMRNRNEEIGKPLIQENPEAKNSIASKQIKETIFHEKKTASEYLRENYDPKNYYVKGSVIYGIVVEFKELKDVQQFRKYLASKNIKYILFDANMLKIVLKYNFDDKMF